MPNRAPDHTSEPATDHATDGATDGATGEASWWPYVLPVFSFLLLIELKNRFDAGDSIGLLAARVVVPLAFLVYFWARGCYPEIRLRLHWMNMVDASLGVALAVMWVIPYLIFPQLQPSASEEAFDPAMAGAGWVTFVLAVRMLGYAVVTPFAEELLMRSFLPRLVDDYFGNESFEDIPIAHFSWKGFAIVVGVFLATHMMWEWWVMLPWAVFTMLWFYYRKDVFALVVVHAATNAAILLAAILADQIFSDLSGQSISLWFFV